MTTLRLQELSVAEKKALSTLIKDKTSKIGKSAAKVSPHDKAELAKLAEKIVKYMNKHGHKCVHCSVHDGDAYIRLMETVSPRKLTVEAVEDALDSITDADIEAKTKALKRRKGADTSLSNVLMELVFKHVRAHHYSHRPRIVLTAECPKLPKGVVVHEVSEYTKLVIQNYYNLKETLKAGTDTDTDMDDDDADISVSVDKSELQAVKNVMLDYIRRTEEYGDERTFRIAGKKMAIQRKVKTRATPPKIGDIKKTFYTMLTPYQRVEDIKRHKQDLAERLIQWIEEEKQRKRQVFEDVVLVEQKD